MQASKSLSLLITIVLPWQFVMAQGVPVVEAGGAPSQSQLTQPGAAGNSQNEMLVNMYLQLEALQNEVQNLRGLVEEQSYQIRRMQTEQRDRYLDVDSRLVELQNQIQGNAGNSQPGASNPVNNSAGQTGPGVAAVVGNNNPASAAGNAAPDGGTTADANIPQSEQEIYRQALALLLEQEQYQDSITLFQQYIDVYPQGRYFTNSLYWQGAALELAGNYNRAVEVLMRLIDNYPTDAKAPTAMLRLGTVYREMGRTQEAVALWRQISVKYPDSTSEIGIANEYLSDLGSL